MRCLEQSNPQKHFISLYLSLKNPETESKLEVTRDFGKGQTGNYGPMVTELLFRVMGKFRKQHNIADVINATQLSASKRFTWPILCYVYFRTIFRNKGTSLVVQWLEFCAPNAGGASSIPSGETKISHATKCGKKTPKHQHQMDKGDVIYIYKEYS